MTEMDAALVELKLERQRVVALEQKSDARKGKRKAPAGAASAKKAAKGTGYGGSAGQWSKAALKKTAAAESEEAFNDKRIGSLLDVVATAFAADPERGVTKIRESRALAHYANGALRNDSLLDISGRAPLYQPLLKLLSALAGEPLAAGLLANPWSTRAAAAAPAAAATPAAAVAAAAVPVDVDDDDDDDDDGAGGGGGKSPAALLRR